MDTRHLLQIRDSFVFLCGDTGESVREYLAGHFELDFKRVTVFHPVHNYLVIDRIVAVDKHRVDLQREYVNALDDEHVDASAHEERHLDVRAPARARLAREFANIPRVQYRMSGNASLEMLVNASSPISPSGSTSPVSRSMISGIKWPSLICNPDAPRTQMTRRGLKARSGRKYRVPRCPGFP